MACREELAWAAGLFDGEGWASNARYSLKTGGMSSSPSVGVGQAHPEVLHRFREAVGVGRVRGPYGKHGTPMYAYKACGLEKVEAVADALWPWLSSVKREQLSEVIEDAKRYRRTHPSKLFSDEQVREIRRRLTGGESQASITLSLGRERQAIRWIARGRAYRGVEGAPTEIRYVVD